MITTKDFTSSMGATITVKYPTGTIFMRERNYLTVSCEADDYYLKRITLADKTINFGRYYLQGNPMTLDVTPYYAKLYTSGTLSLVVENNNGDDETFSVSFTISKVYGYSPYKEITASVCNKTSLAVITPPNRMIKGADSVRSLFVAKRNTNTATNVYVWSLNEGSFDGSQILMKSVAIDTTFKAEYIATNTIGTSRNVLSTITRSVEGRDASRNIVYVTWRTPWGFDVSHVFYLDTFGTDKEDAKEVESLYLYEERRKHVIKGSFYLDNIREPYDLWYYQTLAKSELVTITLDTWRTLENVYMPLGTNEYNGIRITGTNIQDAVVDGITQSTITFDFELL